MLLKGRVALITGGTRGIGRAIAELFVEQGAAVVLTGTSDQLEQTAGILRQKGAEITAVRGSIADESHVKEVIATCRKRHGELHILVNNAGVMQPGLLGMTPVASIRTMLEVNVVGMIEMTQYAIRLMPRGSNGSIINMSSIVGTHGMTGLSAYGATKAAMVGFTLSAAKELAPRGIRVNAIAPGFIDTDMARSASKEWYHQQLQGIRMGQRIGSPSEVAKCALFLASDLSSYVTGQVVGVDGAMSI